MRRSFRQQLVFFVNVLSLLLVTALIQALASDRPEGTSGLFVQTRLPGWWALSNPWNAGRLVNGKDYRQAITINPYTSPNGTVISWTWPNYRNSDNVWGYPELLYGSEGGTWQSPDRKGPKPIRIKNLTALTGTYDIAISGDTDQFDVLWETQLTAAPNVRQVLEFGIIPHSPPYFTSYFDNLPRKYAYNAAGFSATIAITDNGSYPFIIVLPTQGDMLSATVDIKSIFDYLVIKGVLTGNEYIGGFEIGAEPQKNSGTLTIKRIGYNWNGNIVGDLP